MDVPTIHEPLWSTKWVGLSYVVDNLFFLPLTTMSRVKEELGKQILDNMITITIG